jgi:hypothetical protein
VALSPDNALEAARNIVYGPRMVEAERLNRIARSLSPRNIASNPDGATFLGDVDGGTGYTSVEMPRGAPTVMQHLALKARTNFLPLVVDTFAQNMKVDGLLSSHDPDNPQSPAWSYAWQANNLDARQTGVHRSALAYGASYVTVLPGDPGPVIKGVSPRQMTAVYQDPVDDDWPMLAVRVDGDMIRLYDEEMVYFIGVESQPRSGFGATLTVSGGVQWVYLEARPHGANYGGHPVCPIVRFRDRMLLEGEEQYGIIEPLLDIQRRIDETTFGMLVAQYFAAFKQRYVIGWVPNSETEELKANASDAWFFKDKPSDVAVGQFQETDLTRYITSKDSALQDMAAIAQLAPQGLGLSGIHNISGDALALIKDGETRKSSEITTSFGESWEMSTRLAANLHKDQTTATDASLEVRWKDLNTASLAQVVDALGKMASTLGVPPEALWSKIPGFTDQDIIRAKRGVTQADLMAQLQETLRAETVPNVGASGRPLPQQTPPSQ